jgi:hypothetical protein
LLRKEYAVPPHETIQQRLGAAFRAGRPLDLLSSFKGVPVRYKAAIQQIEPEAVIIQVAQREAVCLELEREVVVLGEGGDEALRAEVSEVQLALGRAKLTRVRYADSRLGNRLMVRVEPKAPMAVRLELAGQAVTGQVVDLSMGGLAVQVTAPPELPLKAGVTVPVALDLPSGPVELAGLVRSVRPEGDGKRLGIAFPQDAHVSAIVGYVLQRRVEILAELEQIYEARAGQA